MGAKSAAAAVVDTIAVGDTDESALSVVDVVVGVDIASQLESPSTSDHAFSPTWVVLVFETPSMLVSHMPAASLLLLKTLVSQCVKNKPSSRVAESVGCGD